MNFKRIGVVGGGTMGQGISEMLAGKGLDVLLVEANEEKLNQARWEGLPMVLLEASACELPMVATDVGGNAEIVQDGGGGWLVEPSNPDALAEAMLRMRLTSLSERQEMGRNARAHVLEGYELNKVVERWVGMYLEQGRSESQRPLVEG